jgi:hypothetical protein
MTDNKGLKKNSKRSAKPLFAGSIPASASNIPFRFITLQAYDFSTFRAKSRL